MREMPTNDEFCVLVRARLDLDVIDARQPCQHRYKVDGEIAGPPCPGWVDRKARHAFTCSVGGFSTARHHSLRDTVATECVAAGHQCVEREVVMPQWSVPDESNPGKFRHAILDVYAREPPKWQPRCYDTHCFHPWTAKGTVASATFESRQTEKHERYPTNTVGGQRATECELSAIVLSTYGGCGPEAVQLFQRLAARADPHAPRRFGKRFIARLALVAVKAAARQVLAALGRARETYGLAGIELPPPPVAISRPDAAPLPWEAAARAHGALRAELHVKAETAPDSGPTGGAPGGSGPAEAKAQEKPDKARGGPARAGGARASSSGTPGRQGRQAPRPSGVDPGDSSGAAAPGRSLVASGDEEGDEQEAENAQGSQGAQENAQGSQAAQEPSQDEDGARWCTACSRDRPRHAFAPIQWGRRDGRNTGTRARRCMKCNPQTAPSGQRYCTQCDRAKPHGQFGPNQDGKVMKVCRTCSTQQARLSFFITATPSQTLYQ